jgi:lysophospholipase L1-like esterase
MHFGHLRDAALGVAGLSLAACASSSPPTPTPPPNSDFYVVSLGDSYGAGQGAPNDHRWWELCKSQWDFQRCNRSRWAPTTQAVKRRADAGHPIHHHSFTCSGADIEEGLLGPYDGQESNPGDPPLLPQVTGLAALAANPGDVDAVTISVGGNDVYFARVVAACMLPDPLTCKILKPDVDQALAALPGKLDDLAQRMTQEGVQVPANRIFILGYPDPARDANGNLCNASPPLPEPLSGISAADAGWASEYVLPKLNRRLCLAAGQHGWTYVAPRDEFKSHGWCADPIGLQDNWINTVLQSSAKQGTHRGTMHPTRDGHSAVSERIEDRLTTLLNNGSPAADPCPDEPVGAPPP